MQNRTDGPRALVPAPLCSDVAGTWAYATMSDRIRTDILARIFRENDFAPTNLSRLQALDSELKEAGTTPLSPLEDDGGPDIAHWNSVILEPVLAAEKTWLSAPWAVAEFYFYRRVLGAIDYFRSPVDPFIVQKRLGLSSALKSMDTVAARVNASLRSASSDPVPDLLRFVFTALWGNRMDLSIWPVGSSKAAAEANEMSTGFDAVIEAGRTFILADDSASLASYVASLPGASRYDIIVDNAGFELFCDLCLADFLVASGLASTVHIHLKAHPTFVSDAMAKDVLETVDFLRSLENSVESVTLGHRWAGHVKKRRWVLVEDFFWVQPSPMWEMPTHIKSDLANSSLCFVKGMPSICPNYPIPVRTVWTHICGIPPFAGLQTNNWF